MTSSGLAVPLGHLVGERSRRADGDAGPAELAAGLGMGGPERRADQGPRAAVLERRARTLHAPRDTCARTVRRGCRGCSRGRRRGRRARLRGPGRRPGTRAPSSPPARPPSAARRRRPWSSSGTRWKRLPCGSWPGFARTRPCRRRAGSSRGAREDELQDLFAHLAQRDRVGGHLHPRPRFGAAGERIAAHAGDLDGAQAAAAEGRELLVRAQRRDGDAGQLGGAQDADALGHRDRDVVDLELDADDVRSREASQSASASPDSITMASPAMASKRQIS